MKRVKRYLRKNMYLDLWVLLFLFLAFFAEAFISLFSGNAFIIDIRNIFLGLWKILTSSSILFTDYIYIAGLGATFLNVSIILAFNLLMLKVLKIKMSGPVYAGIVMITGFAFFGKNIINTLPIYLGIFLFSVYRKIPFKTFIITILFSTGVSPLVSYCFFGFGLPLYYAIPLGIVCGILIGFVIPGFASHTIIFHEGYNLYNVGFSVGILSAFFLAIFKFLNLDVQMVSLYDYNSTNFLYGLLIWIGISSIISALVLDKDVLKEYLSLIKSHGRLLSDFRADFGKEAVMFNMGTIALLLALIGLVCKIPFNGVIFGSALSILGFAGFGVHIKNLLPVWIGCFISIGLSYLINSDYTLTVSTIIAFIFASGLAPICGKFGIIYGIFAGIIHIIFTPLVVSLHGGFNLYNNGFAAGFEAALLSVIAEKVRKEKNHGRKSKDL